MKRAVFDSVRPCPGHLLTLALCASTLIGCGDDATEQPQPNLPDAGVPSPEPDAGPGPIDAGPEPMVDAGPEPVNTLPAFVVADSLVQTYYDGTDNDLLTAGLGVAGIQAPQPPAFEVPTAPTVEELRRNAIYSNYQALHDFSTEGGFGRLFGPNIDPQGNPTQGLISGYEYLAYGDDGSGTQRVTMMVQIPDSFNPQEPCLLTAPSSGSRGVYGAIGTSGDWGLKRGCAVVYTDQGKGTGFHNLQANTAFGMRGERLSAEDPGVHFAADLTDDERDAFNAATPNRLAIKHVHSQQNPEKDWGQLVLQSIEFALYVLNEHFHADPDGTAPTPQRITPAQTLIIAAGVSNGGNAVLHAAEEDTAGLIDAVVVSEPNAQPPAGGDFRIVQGTTTWDPSAHSKPFYDYYTLLNLYQPCASRSTANQAAPLVTLLEAEVNAGRCASLAAAGLLEADELSAQASEAQATINAYGFNTEQNILQPAHQFIQFQQAIGVGYANAYGRYAVTENICGFSYGATSYVANNLPTGAPITLPDTVEAALFATSNGLPPTGGVSIIYNDSANGPIDHRHGVSPSTGRADYSFDGALCLRNRWLSDARVQSGNDEVLHTANLRSLPAIMVMGRSDAVLPVNHTARPYFAQNQLIEGDASRLHYYEVTNAHHLDVLNRFPGMNERFVPIHNYFELALELMWQHLRADAPLPPSQVVHTTPRGNNGGSVPSLDRAQHLPPIAAEPAPSDRITFEERVLAIPE